MRPHIVAGSLFGLVVTACLAQPFPSSPPPHIGSPSPSPPASARSAQATVRRPIETIEPVTPSPAPAIPAQLFTTASVERNGVRITIELERNPMPAGETSSVRIELKNLGPGDLNWGSDGCEIPLWVFGTMPEATWRTGINQPRADLQEFKGWALDRIDTEEGIPMGFMPERMLGRGVELGEFGCGDVYIGHRLAAGGSIVSRALWDGAAMRSGAPLPQGRLLLRTVLDQWGRGPDPEQQNDPIPLEMDAWVAANPRAPLLDPGEAVDVALANPAFGAWLLSRPNRNGADTIVKFDPVRHVWRVGLTSYYPTERTRVALIDADTGEILDIVGPIE